MRTQCFILKLCYYSTKKYNYFLKNDVRAVRYVPGRCATRPTDERHGCAQRVPPERGRKNTTTFFLVHRMEHPMTNIRTKPHRYTQMGAEHEHPGIFGAAP